MSLLARGLRRCDPHIAAKIATELNAPVHSLFTRDRVSDFSYNKESKVLEVIEEDPVLEFEDVAERFKIKPKTLRHMRATGEGPPFFKVGQRLKIRRSKADEWFKEKYERADAE
nr:helix-turn-helix domain-containing protein [Nonomuraea sp. FMUSA5-5]